MLLTQCFSIKGTLKHHVHLPVALFHQSLPLLLTGVLLPFVGLVQDLLGRRPPFEAVTSHFLAGGFATDVITWLTHALTSGVELWEKKHRILIAFVCHIAARTLWSLVELCKIIRDTFNIMDVKILSLKHLTVIFSSHLFPFDDHTNDFGWQDMEKSNAATYLQV